MNTLNRLILDRSKSVVFGMVALVLAIALGMANLGITIDYKVFFKKENPQLLAMNAIESTYSKDNFALFVVHNPNGSVFTDRALSAIKDITETAWTMPYALRVDSLTNFPHISANDNDDLLIAPHLHNFDTLTELERDKYKARYLSDPLIKDILLNGAGDTTAINVTLNLGEDSLAEVPEVAAYLDEYLPSLRAKYPELDIYLSGTVLIDINFAKATEQDMRTVTALSYLVITGLLMLLLKSVYATVASLAVVTLAVLTALGIAGWQSTLLNPTVAFAPSIIMVIAVADCVHIFSNYFQARQEGADNNAAVIKTLKLNLQPISLTSLTTAIGFLCLNFSDTPPFINLGNIVAYGVIAAWVLSVVFLPALLVLTPPKTADLQFVDTFFSAFGRTITNHSGKVIATSLIVIVWLSSGIHKNVINEQFLKYFDETFEIRVANDFINENLRGLHRLDYSLSAQQSNGVYDPEYLKTLEDFSEWFKQQPEVSYVASFAEEMKRLNWVFNHEQPHYNTVPETRELAAQLGLAYEMSLPFGADLSNRINNDKSETRLTAYMWSTGSMQILELHERALEWLKLNAPENMNAGAASMDLMFGNIAMNNIPSLIWGTLLALLAISIILMIAFKSVKLGLLSLLPNLIPAALAYGAWGYLNGEVNLSLASCAMITLGMVVDDTIHFLSKFRRAWVEEGASVEDAIHYAFKHVGHAISVTSIVFVLGFGVLSFSHFVPNSQLGIMTAITIFMAWIADLFFFPAVLSRVLTKKPGASTVYKAQDN